MIPKDRDSTTVDLAPRASTDSAFARRQGEACLIIIYGPDLGRRIPLRGPSFEIGRSSRSDLAIEQENVSRQHARIRCDGESYVISDLGSTNGTLVNDLPVTQKALSDGDQVRVGRTILKFMSGDNVEASYHEEIYRLMTMDSLTSLFNRRYFSDVLERELNRASRYNRPLSLVLFDIDHFKETNDQHGHVAGDALLRQLAQMVASNLRREDVLARVGGEEFGILLPEIDLLGARVTADKVRIIIQDARFNLGETVVSCTISLGVATLAQTIKSAQALYGAADAALYAAKSAGRNQVRG